MWKRKFLMIIHDESVMTKECELSVVMTSSQGPSGDMRDSENIRDLHQKLYRQTKSKSKSRMIDSEERKSHLGRTALGHLESWKPRHPGRRSAGIRPETPSNPRLQRRKAPRKWVRTLTRPTQKEDGISNLISPFSSSAHSLSYLAYAEFYLPIINPF